MLQVAVCDDNIDELSNMVQLLSSYRASKHINMDFAVFPNGFDLIAALDKKKRFDIYCLDIIMPGYTGIDVAKDIRRYDKTAPIVFFTSTPEYAVESYSVKAVNYVLKPITRENFFAAFDELLEQTRFKDDDAIVVKSSEGVQRILIDNLVFAEVIGRNVLYHLRSGKVIECVESFGAACDALLKYDCMLKPHRSYILNMQYIDTIDASRITLQTLSSIPIAQGKSKEMKKLYLAYQLEEGFEEEAEKEKGADGDLVCL